MNKRTALALTLRRHAPHLQLRWKTINFNKIGRGGMERVMTHSATRVVPILLCAAFAAPAAAQRGMGGHAGHAIAVAPPPRVAPQLSLPRAAPQISAPHVMPRVMAPQISVPRVAVPQVAPRVSPHIGAQQFAQPSTPGVVQRAPRAFAAPVPYRGITRANGSGYGYFSGELFYSSLREFCRDLRKSCCPRSL